MKLSKLFSTKQIIDRLQSNIKNKAIKEIIETLTVQGVLPKEYAQSVYRAVLKREKVGSTGVGKGIAIPHAKIKTLGKTVAALARSKEGLEFNSVDGEKVFLLFFILSPPKDEAQHLEVLRWVSDVARDADYRRFLREAKSREEMLSILKEADSAISG